MALTKLTQVINIIQSLSDRPNQQEGYTASSLKAKFDEGVNIIKDFINNVLTPEIDDKFANIEGTGRTTETIKGAYDNLETHKASSDHDERYYTETESDNKFVSKTELQEIILEQIPDNSLTEQKMADDMKKGIAGGVAKQDDLTVLNITVNTHLADIVSNPAPNKILRLDGNSKFPATILAEGVNTDITKSKTLELKTDTRSTILTYDINGILTKIEEKDGSTVVKTTNLNYTNGNLASVEEIAGGTTVTTTLTYTNGNLTGVSKVVS